MCVKKTRKTRRCVPLKTINIDFTDSTVGNLGRAGEHNNTKIIFALSPELAKCDFLTAEIGTAAGDKVPIEGTRNEENNTFSILLTDQLTAEGKISLQVVGYVTESDTAEPQVIAKSPVVSGFITEGINGVKTAAASNPNLLARIWVKIREWADKIHTHDNKTLLDGFDSFFKNPFYNGLDKHDLKWNGLTLRMTNEGAVVKQVKEVEIDGKKYFRLYLHWSNGVIFDGQSDFIDVPVTATESVEEVIGSITLNGTGLDLGLAGSGGFTPEQLADLEANTAARHEHENKDVLDLITEDMIPTSESGGFVTNAQFIELVTLLEQEITLNMIKSGFALRPMLQYTLTESAIEPWVYYIFGEVESLTLELAEAEDYRLADFLPEYIFSFVSGATPTVLTLPSSVQWANELTIEANKRYEISIADNIGLWCAVDLVVSE